MSDWDPATEAEAAMRDALVASDQEQYFRILARMDLLLPVSVDALAGRVPMGWGTWTTGNRTHILAFTSPAALRLCLNEPSGSYRAVPFQSLATDWPNYEWWLAIDPGLPIEAYLPSWFVAQLTRGDVHLPGRTMGQRARMAQSDLAAALNGRIRASAPAGAATAATAARAAAPPVPPSGPTPPAAPPVPPSGPTPPAAATAPPRVPSPARAGHPLNPSGAAPSAATPLAYGTPFSLGRPVSAAASKYLNTDVGPAETVEAEIIDYPPEAGREAGAASGHAPGGPATRPTVAAAVAFAAGRAAATGTPVGAPAPPQPTVRPTPGRIVRETHDAEIVSPDESWSAGFVPANETEANLLAAADENNTDAFLSTLLLARIILPVPAGMPPTARPRDRDFPWQVDEVDDQRYISVYTSSERMAEHLRSRRAPETDTVSLRFVQMIGAWPDEAISFAINPGTPVGATLPGSQIVALATWAADVGLREEPSADVVVAARTHESAPVLGVAGAPTAGADRATMMQRTVPHAQVPFYLERGYDRVAGFVNRASEVSHLTSPRLLYRALGLSHAGSPFADDDAEVHILRWVAHRADLYRLPYGGQHEAAMRAMQGWVIERPPFRGNGFAPGDTDVIAEFKVDSVRLPHGAQVWRLAKDGTETLVATYDADAARWMPQAYGGGASA